jgi:hypothetical protein
MLAVAPPLLCIVTMIGGDHEANMEKAVGGGVRG